MGLAADSISSAKQDVAPPGPPCWGHTFTAPTIRHFASDVWGLARWRRGDPPEKVVRSYRHKLRCSAGAGHRKASKQAWRSRRAAFHRHRAYKLRWGECGDAGPIRDCIHGAALTYGADEGWMLGVSLCESGWERYAHNPSGAESWFQFLPSTWATTPYGGRDITSAKWQSLAAAWMYVQGRSGEWVCQA